jgi:hypothetical protein
MQCTLILCSSFSDHGGKSSLEVQVFLHSIAELNPLLKVPLMSNIGKLSISERYLVEKERILQMKLLR